MERRHFVITIGRQTGSGGKEIAQILSEKLGVRCYDKNLITEISKRSGFCEEILEQNDENPTNSLIYSIAMNPYAMSALTDLNMPLNNKLFLAQFDTIKKIAEAESCIFVGRCADYILEGMDGLVRVFITADDEARKAHVVANHKDVAPEKAASFIKNMDKRRAGYYNYYTDKRWGVAAGYDLSINSTAIGFEACADLIIAYLDAMPK